MFRNIWWLLWLSSLDMPVPSLSQLRTTGPKQKDACNGRNAIASSVRNRKRDVTDFAKQVTNGSAQTMGFLSLFPVHLLLGNQTSLLVLLGHRVVHHSNIGQV